MSRPAYEFRRCQEALERIQNGTLSFAGITNETLASTGWIWEGPLALLKKEIQRESITAITYKGCVELCGNNTEMNTPETALGIITTWVFPLAILFSLPYDSLHRNKLLGTATAVSNWLGSPQTAMTATMFNFDQIRKCHREATGSQREDTYYVLSCFNQFELPMSDDGSEVDGDFVAVLVYGLFRPLRDGEENSQLENLDVEYTSHLLAILASQLRLLRRRGVVPTMLSLGTFLMAFVISIYLAFGELGDGVDVTSLTLGLLFSWLPSLVICTIIDRNPVSSERTAALMSRWLYNVNAVRAWKMNGADREQLRNIRWWRREIPSRFKVGEFIGQGRRMRFCGLAHATTSCVNEPETIGDEDSLQQFNKLARDVAAKLKNRRPWLWFSSAIRAFILVWTPILMAFAVAFTSPTVGIGCWSGSFLVFGGMSSFSWTVSLFKRSCGPRLRILCHVVNLIAVIFLIFITGLVLSGAMSNCFCNTTWFAYPHSGGYMTFESFGFVRKNYDVTVPWAVAASVGFGLPLFLFFFEVIWWVKCQHLWRTRETDRPIPLDTRVRVNMDWLQ